MLKISFKQSLISSATDKSSSKTVSAQPNRPINAQYSQQAIERNKSGELLAQEGQFDKAIAAYRDAVLMQPDYADAYFNLAKTYKFKDDYDNAITSFEKYLTFSPENNEALTLLGESYKEKGLYAKAIELFEKAVKLDSEDDFAQRNLKEANNYLKFAYDPRKAIAEKTAAITNNLQIAKVLSKDYLSKNYTPDLDAVEVIFGDTAKLGGYANIAQYEHAKRKITITNEFQWANPALTSAYLTHEYIHAKDNDAYSSIQEEQDAFRIQAQFWQKYGKAIKDPEMDYVSALYKESASKLDARVREIYLIRDPNMPATSPNHPPNSKHTLLSSSLNNNSQPIKSYDIIA